MKSVKVCKLFSQGVTKKLINLWLRSVLHILITVFGTVSDYCV